MAIEAKQDVTFTNVTLNGTISGTSVVEVSQFGDFGKIATLDNGGFFDTSVIPRDFDFDLTVGAGTTEISLGSNGELGFIGFGSGTNVRWQWRKESDAETGSDAGSTLIMRAFNDSGTLIDEPWSIVRAAGGDIDFKRPLDLNANPIKGVDDLTVNEIAAPGTPAAGKVAVYAKTDGKLYIKDDAGTETDLTPDEGSGSFTLTPDSGDYTISQTNFFIRHGKAYFIFFDFEVTATTTVGTGSFALTGLPGTVASNHSGGGLNFLSGLTKTGVDWIAPWPGGVSLFLRAHSLGGGSGSTIQYSDFGSTFRFRGMAIFRVA